MTPAALPLTPHTMAPRGWRANLELGLAQAGTRTVLKHSRHSGPLRVQRPFYPEDGLAHLYILHPPGGVVGGDQLDINVDVGNAAQALFTTPGCGKFYLSAGPEARLEQRLRVAGGGSLEWLPQENILFAGARLQASTRIDVEGDAVFIGWDISCLGRPASRERFRRGTLRSQLTFYHDRELLLVENQRVSGERQLNAAAGLRGRAVQGMLLGFPCTTVHLESVRDTLAQQPAPAAIGATLVDRLLVVRALGDDGETLKQALTTVWQNLRPQLLRRPAVTPRIWAT